MFSVIQDYTTEHFIDCHPPLSSKSGLPRIEYDIFDFHLMLRCTLERKTEDLLRPSWYGSNLVTDFNMDRFVPKFDFVSNNRLTVALARALL